MFICYEKDFLQEYATFSLGQESLYFRQFLCR